MSICIALLFIRGELDERKCALLQALRCFRAKDRAKSGIAFSKIQIFWWHVARYVRRHRMLALLNVLSIALGIAVYLAIQIANESATKSFSATVDMVAGKAHVEVRGDVDELLWPQIERLQGVAAVTGVLESLATFPEKPGDYLRLIGIDVLSGAEFRTFELGGADAAGIGEQWLATPGGVAVTRAFAEEHGLAVGAKLAAVVNGTPATLSVLAIISDGDLPVSDSRIAVMDLGWAQELAQRAGKLSSLQIRLTDPLKIDAAVAAISPIAKGLSVGPPRQRSEQMGKMLAAFQLNLTALSMVSLLVAVFLVFNTVSTSVARRRTEIGIIRALGVTPLGVRAMYLGEALLYAVPGVLLGGVCGVALARLLSGAVQQTITALYTLVNVERLWLEPRQFIVAALYGIAAALVGAWGPAAEASRVDPVAALRGVSGAVREENGIRRWWMGGAVCLMLAAGAAAYALGSGPAWMAFACAFLVLAGFSLLSPVLIPAVRSVFRLVKWLPLRLAAERLRRSMRRNAITVSALAAAVSMLVGLIVMVFSFRTTLDAWIGKGIVADYFIAPAANESFGLTSYLPDEAVRWLRARPEALGVDTFFEQEMNGGFSLAVVDGEYRDNLPFESGDGRAEMARVFGGEAVVVTEPYARRFRAKPGDAVAIETPDGLVKFVIAGVYADYSRDRGMALMSAKTYAKYWGPHRAMSAAVYLHAGREGTALERDFRAAFADRGQFSINTSRSLRDRILAVFDQTFAVTEVLRSVAVVVAIAGVFLTMTALVVERRRELALLRAIGGTASFVGQVILCEAALLGLSAAVLGIASGFVLSSVLTWVVNPAFFGWTIAFAVPVWTLAAIPFWLTAVAVLAAWWPARLARNVEIANALRGE
jgi:putative ABC transport system permease protein